ncbi:hypothetical protein GIB67_014936 [Kingdonia uniflora]|uniref:Telomere-associated protein Rif1 N-terminal domain-containing protein n=1 Tax=Kingdonia uniflora TaxID=39325 RepID=A0A7J7MTK9_9MAGN|nr:hypothetical protein GIB67_014936 [Kingdonia uniflora]
MADFTKNIQEIESLLASKSITDRSFAYSNLLHLQEQSTEHSSAIQALKERLQCLISSIISDIWDEEEEIAAQALKCLGFMIYHPSLVVAIPEEIASSIVESLAKLITSTKMKASFEYLLAICNLGVWCISVQQINLSLLSFHFQSLLRAVIHALDNPIGSLSTTFEGIQALAKLASQLSENMRNTSNLWAPPIYRRLLSIDKRERDMAERCLLKIRTIILPPPLSLSKALVVDLKKKLLREMKELLQNHGRKVQTILAWGWFIRLLGPYALKNRHLVNEMMNIPQCTFLDSDPQVQIASQVAWEGLIDALIDPPVESLEKNMGFEHGIQQISILTLDTSKDDQINTTVTGLSKSIRLIMTPLIGIMSSKCDISVRSSCLNTWCYLLHKLELFVNHPSIVKTVLEPILEAVFQTGPDSTNIWVWNSCLDLLEEFISAKSKYGSSVQPAIDGECLSKGYPIRWLPLDLSNLHFHIKIIQILIKQGLVMTLTGECRSLRCNAALRIYRSVLKEVQIVLKKSSINYTEIMLCLNSILSLIKQVCEAVASEDFESNCLLSTSLQFIEVVRKEFEPSILASPLYKVALDLKYIEGLQVHNGDEYLDVPGVNYMDTVPPVVYLSCLYLLIAAKSISSTSQLEIVLYEMEKHLKFFLSSYDPLEYLGAIIGVLYKQRTFKWLKVWRVVGTCLDGHINGIKDSSSLKKGDKKCYEEINCILSYPLVICSSETCLISSKMKLELELAIEVWKSLYCSVNCLLQLESFPLNSFSENLCQLLTKVCNKYTGIPTGIEPLLKDTRQSLIILPLFGEVAICLSKQILVLDGGLISKGKKLQENGVGNPASGIKNSLEYFASFMKLSLANIESGQETSRSITSKVFSALASFVGRLHLRLDILLFVEVIFDPLAQWLSTCGRHEMQEGSVISQLQLLWSETLNLLQRSCPPIIFDSFFLKVQAKILETTLDHPNSTISRPTTLFWNSTYAYQTKLDYPQNLLPVLDKLSRNGTINIHKKNPPVFMRDVNIPPRYKVSITQKTNSKRVELLGDNAGRHFDTLKPCLKKKKLELTEHQKEVKRAQQGRERDCNGHGPGFRTYTSMDFSLGNEDSQESQELRDPEAILEMLRRN